MLKTQEISITKYLRAAVCGEEYISDENTLGSIVAEDELVTDAVAEDIVTVAAAAADTVWVSLPIIPAQHTHTNDVSS